MSPITASETMPRSAAAIDASTMEKPKAREFLRLRDRKQVKFSAKWTGSETQIFVNPAPVFSSFVQKNAGGKWHVPYYSSSCVPDLKESELKNQGVDEDEKNEQEELVSVKWKCF